MNTTINGYAMGALGAVGVTAVLIAMKAPSLMQAVTVPAASATEQLATLGDREAFDERMGQDKAQFEGRSVFFRPPPPPPPPPPPVERPVEREPEPPRKPTSYGGPKIIGMMDDRIWFANGQTLAVGGDEERGIRVVAWNPPWSATIEWEEVEFEVGLFERTTEKFLDPVPDEDTTDNTEEEDDTDVDSVTDDDDSESEGAE